MKGFKRGYCKYCYQCVSLNIRDDLIICSKCGYGLAPLEEAIKYKSFNKWLAKISIDPHKMINNESKN